jgi:hypothetical protein
MYLRHLEAASAPALARATPELTRRQFLALTTLAGSGLTLGVVLPGCAPGGGTHGAAASAGELAVPFVRIAADDTVTVMCKHL